MQRFKMMIIIIFIFILVIIVGKARGESILSIYVADEYTNLNENVTVYLNITPDRNLSALQCNISFNPDILEAIKIIKGNVFDMLADDLISNFTVIDNINGTITNLVAFSFNSTNKSGTVVEIIFHSKDEENASINISDFLISDEDANKVEGMAINGSVMVDATAPSMEIHLSPYTQTAGGNVNISVLIKDTSGVEKVMLNVSYPDGESKNYSILENRSGNIFYSNLTYSLTGTYEFYVYAVDFAGNTNRSHNFSFNVYASNIPPVANFSFFPENPVEGEEIIFNASASYDFNGYITNYTWNFGDGYITYGMVVNHVYTTNASYMVNLTVRDDDGATDYIQKKVVVSRANSPPVKPYNPSPPDEAKEIALNITLSWQCYDVDNDTLTYDVYFGLSPAALEKKESNTTASSYDVNNLQPSTTYYWRIVAWDENGAMATGSIWDFTTLQNEPPVCSLSVEPNSGYAPLSVVFYLTTEDDRGIVWWKLDVDSDGIAEFSGNGNPPGTITYVYDSPASYTANLTVMDGDGNEAYSVSSVTVLSPPTYYTLHVTIYPNNAGYVNPSGGTYREGSSITLTAVAYEGYSFDHWGGDASGSEPTLHIIMNSNTEVAAYFSPSPPPNQPPSVAITSPVNGSVLSGITGIAGTSTDTDGSIEKVEIRVDSGEWITVEGTTTWSYSWDTSTTSNGEHVIEARAYDGMNYSNIASITVTVNNAPVPSNNPPHVIIISPENGSIVKGSIVIKGKAWDEDGNESLVKVEIRVDSGEWITVEGTTTWSYSWDTSTTSNGEHVIEARAYDGMNYSNIAIIKIDVMAKSGKVTNLFYTLLAAAFVAFLAIIIVIYRKGRKKGKVVEAIEEKKCFVCLGKFKPNSKIVECDCGALFHKTCAERVKTCPNCGRKLV